MSINKSNQHSIFKKNVLTLVKNLNYSLEEINKFTIDREIDEELRNSFESIRDIVSSGILEIKKNIDVLSKFSDWDNLNVSFFGETNAGKSTIIESLIGGNGSSIGEGYKDFTKKVSLCSYRDIKLMDMPGIEGNENKLIESIRKAVNMSHIVFYVIGTNKEVEDLTISKVRRFLKDNARVYSVINSRGKPTAYKFKKELNDENTIIVEKRVKKKFHEILGGNYAGNVIVNGYLALLSSDKLKKTRFEQEQKKAIHLFGDKEKVEEFSNIKEIRAIINELKRDISSEIKISNTFKFLKTIEFILSSILREKKSFDSFIEDVSALTQRYMKDIEGIFSKYEHLIELKLESDLERMKVEMKQLLSKSIDEGQSKEYIKSKIEHVKKTQSDNLNKDIKNLLSSMNGEIEAKIKEFKNRMSLKVQFLEFRGALDLEKILQSLEISFKYVVGQLIDVGLSIYAVIGAFAINPILGVITGLFAIVRKFWDWLSGDPDRRKREAKQKAHNKIESMIAEIADKIQTDLRKEMVKIKESTNRPITVMNKNLRGIKSFSASLDDKISEVISSHAELSLLLSRELLGKDVAFSYIDLQLSEAVIVGFEVSSEVKSHLKKLFRLKSISLYHTYDQWLGNVSDKDRSGNIIANNEFNYRAINALAICDYDAIDQKTKLRKDK